MITFTRRQNDILNMLVNGSTNADIARALGISNSTTGEHINALKAKTGTRTRTGLVVWAIANTNRVVVDSGQSQRIAASRKQNEQEWVNDIRRRLHFYGY
jgi:DNA-binding CsgD family transcriptional regulator